MRTLLISILLMILIRGVNLSAQYYQTGQDPASVRWMQIKTPEFRVIYPESYGNEGMLFAGSIDASYKKLTALFPEKKFRIPVIIHNYSTESNGYVAWAPSRMEVYPAPDQNSIPLDTKTQLTIHELTHVYQMLSLNKGFSKFMTYLLGEQFTGINSVLLPLWYLEGNAVFAESALTSSGRGRTPSFLRDFKAITLENKYNCKYDLVVNNSFKRHVPNYYHSGYQIVTYALDRYGHDIWNNALDYTARYPFTADPVNISLLRQTGKTKRKLYEETFDTLRVLWQKELELKKTDSLQTLNPVKKGKYINYYSPSWAGTDKILAIKTSLVDPAGFVIIDTKRGIEKRIHTPGQMYPFHISYGGGRIAWIESRPDPRWDNRSYLVLKVMELATGEIKTLSATTRYLAASISPDGNRIAVSENSIDNRNSLIITDAATGEIILSERSPENAALQRPQWSSDGKSVTVISLTEKGEAILAYSPEYRTWTKMVEYSFNDLQSAYLAGDSLFYVSSESGTEEIHLRKPDGGILKLTVSEYGINDISVESDNFIFSSYTAYGFDIVKARIQDFTPEIIQERSLNSQLINRFDQNSEIYSPGKDQQYTPEPFRKWKHLFRFHSWMPFYADIDEIKTDPASVRPGFSLFSQNLLSTLITETGYEFNEQNEHMFHSKITWQGWYPVIESKIDYGGDPGILNGTSNAGNPSDVKRGIRWINRISLPLRYSTGRFSQYLQPSLSYDYRNNYIYLEDEGKYDYGQGLLSGRLFFSNYHRSSYRDIYPPWAQTFDLNYTYSPLNGSIYPEALSLRTSFYIPGIFQNNGIKIRFEREKQGEATYSLNNRISFPRGYKNIISKDLTLISADYTFPIAYPDFNLSGLLFLKRLRGTLFGDHASGTDNLYIKYSGNGLTLDERHDFTETFQSFGFELIADFHVLRLPFMISGGLQSAWKDVDKDPEFKFLLNIELFGMVLNNTRYWSSHSY